MVYTDKVHLVADSLEELHEFAAGIGMCSRWFQRPPKASYPHYDVMGIMVGRAIQMGAQVISRKEILRIGKKLLKEFQENLC